MNRRSILTNTENRNNLLDMINVRNLTTKNTLKQSEMLNKYKYQSKELKKFSLNSLKSSINNPNTMSSKNNNNLTEIQLLKYRPKRLVKIKEQGKSKLPFSKIGGLSLDFSKTYSSDDKKNIIKNNDNQSLISKDNEKLMNSNNDNEFKSIYIFKFAKNSEEFNKISKNSELMDDISDRRIFEEAFLKLSKLMENQNKLLFNNFDKNTNNKNSNSNNISVINNFDTTQIKSNYSNNNMKNHYRNQPSNEYPNIFSFTSNNLGPLNNLNNSTSGSFFSQNSNYNMKKLIISWSDFIVLFNKFLSQIFNKFSNCKKENEKYKKKCFRDELKLNTKIKELDDLNKYLKRFDVNMKINQQIQKKKEIDDLHKSFKKKENEYLLLIFRLEDEIRDLTILLDKNKNYYDEYKNISKEIDKSKRQCEILKTKFNRELQETNVKILIEKDNQDELKVKIDDLNETIKEMKKEKEISKKEKIELQAKIKKLEMVIGEKKENILMLNEELEWHMRKLKEVQFNNDNMRNEFSILEKKLMNLEDEKQKEMQNKKKEINNIKKLEPLSPKQYKNEDNNGFPSPITDFTQGNNS